jgi:hypothetical protein
VQGALKSSVASLATSPALAHLSGLLLLAHEA